VYSCGLVRIPHRCIEAKILGGEFDGEPKVIPRIQLLSTEGDLPFTLMRRQLPIRLCFAMTFNKSQGQSLDVVGVDLRSDLFTHGQLYAALSRVTDVAGLMVLQRDETPPQTDNIVYREVLL
jgi:ATP-dependent DNA helicase PIF1